MKSETTPNEDSGLLTVSCVPDMSVKMNFLGKYRVDVPSSVVKSLCVIGAFAAIYSTKYLWKGFCWSFRKTSTGIAHLFHNPPKQGTAIIYGATNKIGKAYAARLAEDNFTLLLIDYSKEKLYKLQQQLSKTILEEDRIICCCLDRSSSMDALSSDEGIKEIYKHIKEQQEITYFINCRNLKKREIQLFHMIKIEDIILMTYYNMTFLAAILRKVLKVMSASHKGKIISINTAYNQETLLKKTHPLFYATSRFSLTLMQTLKESYHEFGIDFLIVNNNYRNTASNNKYKELVEQSINKAGIEAEIEI